MLLRRFRRSSPPVAAFTVLSLLLATLQPRAARAGGEGETAPAIPARGVASVASVVAAATPSASEARAGAVVEAARAPATDLPAHAVARESRQASGVTQPSRAASTAAGSSDAQLRRGVAEARVTAASIATTESAIASGDDKTGVSSQAISVPQGTGKLQGMGESFSTQMSTGAASFSVPFSLAHARGAVQPSLALSYSSGGGHGLAGVGWDVGWPYIARQTDRGLPGYDDRADWHAQQDRFVFNGGQELVPICTVAGGACTGSLAGEVMPAWSSGWQYFRARVDGSYLRFFWSADHRTWRVQSRSGDTMELGVPLDGSGDAQGLEVDPSAPAHVFRWNLIRQYDDQGSPPPAGQAQPKPVNVVLYRYQVIDGATFLTDVLDTPRVGASVADAASYAHHARLSYEWRPDSSFSYRRGWRVDQTRRLSSVEVSSYPIDAATGSARKRVRRYRLAYDALFQISLLKSVQQEGRCTSSEATAPSEGDATVCDSLPAMAFDYQHVVPGQTLFGYEAMNEAVQAVGKSPPHSLDDKQVDLFDVNGDGLPDLLATMPGLYGYGNGHAVFFNGAGGHAASFGDATPMSIGGTTGEDASIVRLSNPNVAALDVNGDGVINLVNMPQSKTYGVYSPQHLASGWSWVGTPVTTASQQSTRIDFRHNPGTLPGSRVMDVNGDGLVDVVASVATTSDPTAPPSQLETFFALGRYPGGDGQYGTAAWTGPTTARIANEPVTFCGPWSDATVKLSDPDVRVADMNGDGLSDIVRIRDGQLIYWPGRGNGYWGTGPLGGCAAGATPASEGIVMTSAPHLGVIGGSRSLLVDDVNGDGRDDVVVVSFGAVTVYLNINGTTWTDAHVIASTPPRPAGTDRVRLVDINGNGTRDIVWGEGNAFKYVDLLGGVRPWTLTHIDNGLGKTTDIEYGSSTDMMLAAEAAGQAWTSKAPMPLHVVRSMTERDNLEIVGRPAGQYVTQYVYADPVYDGRQREFRGFRSATATRWGDGNSPTSISASSFLLGECADDEAPPAGLTSACGTAAQWADNPREALKGLPAVTETRDDGGVYLSTAHHQYTVRKLYAGRDGRAVRVSFESQTDTWSYDTAGFAKAESSASVADIVVDAPAAVTTTASLVPTVVRASKGTAHLRTRAVMDPFGNATESVDAGCVDGSGCPAVDAPIHSTHAFATAGDGGGWTWRSTESYVDGLVSGEKRNRLSTSYDANGRAVTAQASLAGTLPLDRFHEVSGAAHAGNTAPRASVDGTVVLQQWAYDAMGNVVAHAAPNGRCHTLEYTTDFADLATREHVYAGYGTGGSCGTLSAPRGANDLAATASYDRGLGVNVDVRDIHGEHTQAVYDGLGRLVQMWKPSPTQLGATSKLASVLIDYDMARAGRPYSIVHTQTLDGKTEADAVYHDAYAYADGLGRAILTVEQADPGVDLHGYVAKGLTEYDNKGTPRRKYLAWFWDGDPRNYPIGQTPPAGFARQRYDAFGREIQSYALDGTVSIQTEHHALSIDKWDAADLQPGPHAGTYATEQRDGHGRVAALVERIHVSGGVEARATRTDFLPTGEPYRITRTHGRGDDVVRWLRYDTLGRVTLNVEPDTSVGFTADPGADPASLKAWRYAYDDNGDLVGVSDARGCGTDYHYDTAGRVVAEDYSPCLASHAAYSAPDPSSGSGVEVFYQYDAAVPASLGAPGATAGTVAFDACVVDPALQNGRLVVVSDRGSRTINSVDGRGRLACAAKQLARPGASSSDALSSRYAPAWYARTVAYDAADRPVASSTGAKVVVDPATGASVVHTDYTDRGTVRRVSSSYGQKDSSGWADVVQSVSHDADGLAATIVYGDAAHTTTALNHDQRRRLASAQTYRGAAPSWSANPATYAPAPTPAGAPSAFQLLLADVDYLYDAVDNPVEIHDWRTPSEWPAGAQPVTQKVQYDDSYRVTRVDYAYPAGSDAWLDPFAAEAGGSTKDPRRALPSPHLTFGQRPLWETYQYDWLGNTSKTDDDAKGFYDRSLGAIRNGTAGAQPYQIKGAAGGAGLRDGALTTAYDAAGNLAGLSVVRNANAPCAPSGTSCSQRFAYEWDEVGHLSRARRWDGASLGAAGDALPAAPAVAELRFAYDAKDNRVLKTATDARGTSLYTAYVFESLELRRAAFDGTNYQDTVWTEVPYLFSHGVRLARVHYATTDAPTATSGQIHVLMELPDHLGSNSIVIDRETSELVERSTYLATGVTESDYRPARWESFREDYTFTGKEEDIEVGLQYFGKRYYSPRLGRWMSADPLAVHGFGADANLYAYVKGQLLRSTDPFGLDSELKQYTQWDVFKQTMSDVGKMAEKVPGFMYEGGKQTVVDTAEGLVHTAEKTADIAVRTVDAIQSGNNDQLKQIGQEAVSAAKETAVGAVKGMAEGTAEYGKAIWRGDVEKVSKTSGSILAQAALMKGGEVAGKALGEVAKGATREAAVVEEAGVAKAAAGEGSACTGGSCGGSNTCFVAGTLVATASGLVPIESVRLGDRVLAAEDDDADGVTAVIPAAWRSVDLVIANPDNSGDVLLIRTLRPLAWLDALGITVGGSMHLVMPELDVAGWARVDAIGPAPALQPGRGRVVLSTASHLSREVQILELDGARIETTPLHPLYSLDRGAWVATRDLAAGERLPGRAGAVRVERVSAKLGVERVYNLEVEERHTYEVSPLAVLVHNVGCNGGTPGNSTPGGSGSTGSGAGKQFTSEQRALVDMAKSDKAAGGISSGDMKAYVDLNAEAGAKGFTAPDAVRGPEAHPLRTPQSKPGPGQSPHGHVGPVSHIPVKVP